MSSFFRRVLMKFMIIPLSLLGFLRKDFTLLFRKKKYLYLSLLLPLLIGLIYVFTLTGSSSNITIMVCDYDDTYVTKKALSTLDTFTVTRETGENCTSSLEDKIKKREFLFGVVIREGFTENLNNFRQANMELYYDNSEPSIASLASWKIDVAIEPFESQLVKGFSNDLKEKSDDARDKTQLALEVTTMMEESIFSRLRGYVEQADSDLEKIQKIDPEFVASPIVAVKKGVYPEHDILDVGIAPLFSVLSLFLLLMLCSTGVIYDRKIRLFSRIRASNSPMFSYIISKLIFFFALVTVQLGVVMLIFIMFGASYNFHILLLLKALAFITLVNTLLGFLIGLVSDSEGVAVLISLIITLPLLFLSGMFYPLELMPGFIEWIARIMPLNIEILLMKKALLFGGAIESNLFWIPAVLFLVCLYLLRKQK